MKKRVQGYRQIYKKHWGEIPKDEHGRSYDIHHKDGDHTNNSPENLIAVPIQEHYDIHYQNKDWAACQLIALRMKLSPEKIAELASAAAKERAEKGTHPWQSDAYATSVRDRIKKEVESGTYHMLGGKIQKESQLRRSSLGIHQWCGPTGNLQMLQQGTHPSQKEFICPHCGTKGKGSTNAKRWHFDNCKQKKD